MISDLNYSFKVQLMAEKRYIKHLYQSFKKTGGYILFSLGTVCSILSFIFKDSIDISPLLVIVGTFCLILIFTFFDLSVYFYNETLNNLPKVFKVINRDETTILLTEYSDLLQIQGFVTIYCLNEYFEEYIGYGEVINIQNDKKVQIYLKEIAITQTRLEEIRNSLIIKPYVTSKIIRYENCKNY